MTSSYCPYTVYTPCHLHSDSKSEMLTLRWPMSFLFPSPPPPPTASSLNPCLSSFILFSLSLPFCLLLLSLFPIFPALLIPISPPSIHLSRSLTPLLFFPPPLSSPTFPLYLPPPSPTFLCDISARIMQMSSESNKQH